jgi:uncharacterized repeat protein (TIGR03987 family)
LTAKLLERSLIGTGPDASDPAFYGALMSNMILLSVVLITLALVLYSIAVWMNCRAGRLTAAMTIVFWIAIVCDATATRLMGLRAETIRWDLHTISGYLALALMIGLAAWGTAALVAKRERWLTGFPATPYRSG